MNYLHIYLAGLVVSVLVIPFYVGAGKLDLSGEDGQGIAFFGAFILMQFSGVTLNILSMFGLILVLGIIVESIRCG